MDIPQSPAHSLTSKDRMIQALTGQKPDVLPAAPAYLCLFLADFERAFYIEQYRLRLRERGCDRYPVDHVEDTLYRARATFQSYGIFKDRPDWIETDLGVSRAWAARMDIVERDWQLYFEDRVSGKRVAMQHASLSQGGAELSDVNPAESDILDLSAQIRHASCEGDRDDADRPVFDHPRHLAAAAAAVPVLAISSKPAKFTG